MKPLCVVSSPVLTRSGYGDHSRSIVKGLLKSDKYDVKLIPMPWGACPNIEIDENNPDHGNILAHILRENLTEKPDIWIQITIPNEFQPQGKFNIGITAGIEATKTRPEWIEGLNRMDLNITTSKFSAEVFHTNTFNRVDKQTGKVVSILSLEKPLEVLFEGLDLNVFSKKVEKPAQTVVNSILSELPEFCYLAVGHWLQGNLGHDRKDLGMLVKVFLDTFKRKKNKPALVLKTSGAGFSEVENEHIRNKVEQIYEMIRMEGWTGKLPDVYFIFGELSDAEMNALYNHKKIKAMVSFTHGEGFGRPLLEFTVTGKPVICPRWSGQLDFLNSEHAILLNGVLDKVDKSAQNDWLINEAEWFRVDYVRASNILMDCFENYDKFLELTKHHAKFSRENFSEERMFEQLDSILDKHVKVQPKPSLVKLNLPKLTKVN